MRPPPSTVAIGCLLKNNRRGRKGRRGDTGKSSVISAISAVSCSSFVTCDSIQPIPSIHFGAHISPVRPPIMRMRRMFPPYSLWAPTTFWIPGRFPSSVGCAIPRLEPYKAKAGEFQGITSIIKRDSPIARCTLRRGTGDRAAVSRNWLIEPIEQITFHPVGDLG